MVKHRTPYRSPSSGVLACPSYLANTGAMCSWGVEALPRYGTRCSSSPNTQPVEDQQGGYQAEMTLSRCIEKE